MTLSPDANIPSFSLPEPPRERNWMPILLAFAAAVIVLVVVLLVSGRGKHGPVVSAVNAPLDGYASSLPITNIQMSEAGNYANAGKQTYVDGDVTNHGTQTVTGVTVQVLFHNYAHEVVQNETLPMNLIRTREPYIDTEPVSADPIKPGEQKSFHLIFETVASDWDGAYPELRILKVETK